MQEKCLNFGFLGLISSLVVFFYIEGITIILAVFGVFLGVIIIIHFIELRSDFEYYSERAAPKKNKI
jgi:hypothetical protein